MDAQVLTPEVVSQIQDWFDDADTIKYVGGSKWLNTALDRFVQAIGKEFRGAKVIDRAGYVFYQNDAPVCYVEAEVYDSLTSVSKLEDEVVVDHREDLITAAIVYIVKPAARGQGIAKRCLQLFMRLPRFKDVRVFLAGTEMDNVSSMRLLASLGFRQRNFTPDFEDMINWELKVEN